MKDLKLITIDQLLILELCKISRRFLDQDLPDPMMRNMKTNATRDSLVKSHPI